MKNKLDPNMCGRSLVSKVDATLRDLNTNTVVLIYKPAEVRV